MLTRAEVQAHNSRKSCWVIINGEAYDLTSFLDSHPGGAGIILKYGGRDATEAFEPIHPSDTLENHLSPDLHLGPVSGPSNGAEEVAQKVEAKAAALSLEQQKKRRLASIINIRDFELAVPDLIPARSYAYFKAGADSEYTSQWNRDSWQAIRFRPRVLRPIESIDMSTTIFGNKYSAPFFICPAGGGKLANSTGEVLMTKAAAKHDVLHWVCNVAGCSQKEMTAARGPNQTTHWQIYAMSDLAVTEREIKQAVKDGYKGFALTVDAIRAGKRERDMRMGLDDIEAAIYQDEEEDESFSKAPTVKRGAIWSTFDWVSFLKWMRTMTDLPVAIKGIQTWEDAKLCMEHGVHPWLSNHGGRQLEGAPSAAETLVSIRKHCPEVFDKCEVIVDGGVLRGSDILKALCLGAKGVGLGRGFLYSLVFGEVGVSKAIRILKHELEIGMALLGVTSIDQLNHSYVDTTGLAFASAFPRAHL